MVWVGKWTNTIICARKIKIQVRSKLKLHNERSMVYISCRWEKGKHQRGKKDNESCNSKHVTIIRWRKENNGNISRVNKVMRNVGHSTTNCKNVRDMWKHNCKRLKYVQYINYCKALIFNEVKYHCACFWLSLSRELGSSILTKRNRPELGKRFSGLLCFWDCLFNSYFSVVVTFKILSFHLPRQYVYFRWAKC